MAVSLSSSECYTLASNHTTTHPKPPPFCNDPAMLLAAMETPARRCLQKTGTEPQPTLGDLQG